MISKTLRRTIVLGDWNKDGDEHHVLLYADEQNGKIIWVDFKVFHVAGSNIDGTEKLLAGENHPVKSYDLAEPDAEGFVKWDGCTQFAVDGHVDNRQELTSMFAAIERARSAAAELMPEQDIANEYR